MSLARRVVAAAALVGALIVMFSAAVLFENARTAVAVETAAGQRVARDYALAVLATLLHDNDPSATAALLPGVLTRPRHAAISVIDGHGGQVPAAGAPPDRRAAPAWFARLLRPPWRETVIPIRTEAGTFGRILITPDPTDEIDEVWQDFSNLAVLVALGYFAGLLSLGLLVRRTLQPLKRMAEAVDRLEAGDFAARIGAAGVPELNGLAARFDHLAKALEIAFAEKDALNLSLLDVQDAERKAIALELHDEFGPCLFGLRVEARALMAAAERQGDREQAERAAAVIALVEAIQRANRALLDRLRPMALGQLPLAQVLDELVGTMVALGGETAWTVAISDALSGYDETSELTIYRVAQEAITNALRHAGATGITVTTRPVGSRPEVEIVVEDDGRGIDSDRGDGLGLKGMRERVTAAGGTLSTGRRAGGGAVVRAVVPVRSMREVPS